MTTKQIVDGRYELSFLCLLAAFFWASVMIAAHELATANVHASQGPLPPSEISGR
jgi:hypothetical protein